MRLQTNYLCGRTSVSAHFRISLSIAQDMHTGIYEGKYVFQLSTLAKDQIYKRHIKKCIRFVRVRLNLTQSPAINVTAVFSFVRAYNRWKYTSIIRKKNITSPR